MFIEPSIALCTIDELENEEMKNGVLTAERYTQLFSTYLYTNELCAAKFLWRRVPECLKDDIELQRVWSIGKALWKKQYTQAYELLKFKWPETLKPVMGAIKCRIQQDRFKFISMHYENIEFEKFQTLMGVNEENAKKILEIEGWTCENGYVIPIPINEPELAQLNGGHDIMDRLITLSSFTSYIEN